MEGHANPAPGGPSGISQIKTHPIGAILLLASIGAVWWLSIRMLWNEWEIDPQYSYGFLVPILCAALFFQRWQDRPAPATPPGWTATALAFPPVLLLCAIQPFFEANPEWRVLGVAGALCATAAILFIIHALGGTPWTRHFAFPILFFLIAVPWPRNAEEALMGFLMEKNAIAALEVLHWCGYQAIRRGHLIALPTGTLGVEEACSGVRSLQSGIMAALFFGEIFRFGVFSRTMLVLLAIGVSVVGNFLRATGLAVIASHQGIPAVDQWHDFAGYAILALTLGTLWLVCYLKNKNAGSQPRRTPPQPAFILPPPVRTAAAIVLISSTASLAATEAWYRLKQPAAPASAAWTITPGTPGTKNIPVPDRTRRVLFHPEGFSETFRDTEGYKWQFFFFRWPPGRTAIQALGIHDPRTCLGSLGMEMKRHLPSATIEAHGVEFPFRVYEFDDSGRRLLVFHAILSDGSKTNPIPELDAERPYDSLLGRWEAVKNGSRNSGQSLLEAAVWDTDDPAAAAETLRQFLERAVSAGPPRSTASTQ